MLAPHDQGRRGDAPEQRPVVGGAARAIGLRIEAVHEASVSLDDALPRHVLEEGGRRHRLAGQEPEARERRREGLVAPGAPVASLVHPVEANEIFVVLPPQVIAGLRAAGFNFYDWTDGVPGTIRLVLAFNTDPAHVEAFIQTAGRLAAEAA